jgi:hypothetical protein
MKNLFLISTIILLLTSCQKKQPLTTQEKMLCGHWMMVGRDYNQERYIFKHTGAFVDLFTSGIEGFRAAESWEIRDNKLILTYKSTFILFPFRSNPAYRIVTLNDSTLVLGTRATRRHAAINWSFKKMKLHGKFISA